ncbi:putative Autophagy-related protein 2-like protein A [Hypsibius exemplaris]|uniref:Autophagy-related protein 2 n=1 Tax=Hypsibius exemplaris TaxID=2072580 RepID=A0A1W0W9V9_HYPEX|nr:putative Autophagy-related protein 2-like protein A [Hypsibius exemplaris]
MGNDDFGYSNKFEMCTNSAVEGSDSSSDISDEEYERGRSDFRSRHKKMSPSSSRSKSPSEACVIFNINKASVGARIENSGGKLLPQHAAWMELGKVSIFSVSGFRGQPEIKYSAIKIHQAALFYGDWIEPTLLPTDQILRRPTHVLPLLTALDEELCVPGSDKSTEDQPMLNLAVEIHVDTFRNVKDIKVALELAGVRLHHRVTRPEDLWLTQLIEYLNLKDFPVLGYNSPSIITEFHLNISNSAMDYRPLFHPVSALVSVQEKITLKP